MLVHQSAYHGRVPGDVLLTGILTAGSPKYLCPSYWMWIEFAPLPLWKNGFNVKYVEDGVGLNGGQRRNHPLAFDWHHDL